MTSPRPYCCLLAEFDGFTPEEHARVCREPREPQPDALFDLDPPKPQEGGPQL